LDFWIAREHLKRRHPFRVWRVREVSDGPDNSLRGPSVQPGTKPDIQAGIQGAARRGSGRVESTLRGLIQAGQGTFQDFSGLSGSTVRLLLWLKHSHPRRPMRR